MGAASPEDVLRALALQSGLPFIAAEELPSAPPIIKNLSPKYLRQYVSCPIALDGATVTVATAYPANPLLLDDLRQTLGGNIALCVAPAPAILEAIERAYGASTPLQKIVEGIGSGESGEPEEDINHLRDMAFEAPVVRLVNLLIEEAVASEASDIHVEPFEEQLRVRYRAPESSCASQRSHDVAGRRSGGRVPQTEALHVARGRGRRDARASTGAGTARSLEDPRSARPWHHRVSPGTPRMPPWP